MLAVAEAASETPDRLLLWGAPAPLEVLLARPLACSSGQAGAVLGSVWGEDQPETRTWRDWLLCGGASEDGPQNLSGVVLIAEVMPETAKLLRTPPVSSASVPE